MSSARSAKRDIEKARQEKAAAKRERRQGAVATSPDDVVEPQLQRSQEEILAVLATLHERFEEGSLTFSDFEEEKAELMRSLHVD